MTNIQKQKQQQQTLQTTLWSIANDLRGNMDANEFKNYILGLIFFRYLSENLVDHANNVLLKDDKLTYQDAWKNEEYRNALKADLLDDSQVGYYIEPQFLYSSMIERIKVGTFDITQLAKAANALSDSVRGSESEDDFEHLFDDMDLNSSKLGKTEGERTKLISTIMQKINDIDFMHEDAEIDVLGDAYEYLIGNFAASAGKKAGEFYTPQQVSKILAKIVTLNKTNLKSVYDPTCGSGSLLLRVGREAKVTKYYGQELNSTTFNLARMNMLLHHTSYKNFDIKNDDTLEKPRHLEMKFEAVVANPPFGTKWSADEKFIDDPRFNQYGRLAPKTKADFAFVQHMIYQLDDNGTLAVVLPHGVLFRGAAEGTIRQYLIEEKNYLDAVIGLPSNLFFGAGIAVCILVLKKCRENSDGILFIDASKEFEPGKNQNNLTDANVDKIISTYRDRAEIDKYSKLVMLQEIRDNEYNLNIPRYVDSFEADEEIDPQDMMIKIHECENKELELKEKIEKSFKELGL